MKKSLFLLLTLAAFFSGQAQWLKKLALKNEFGIDVIPLAQMAFKTDLSPAFGVTQTPLTAPSISYRLHYRNHALRVRYAQSIHHNGEIYSKSGNSTMYYETFTGFLTDKSISLQLGYQYTKNITDHIAFLCGIEWRKNWMHHEDRTKSVNTYVDPSSLMMNATTYGTTVTNIGKGTAGIIGLRCALRKNLYLTFETALVGMWNTNKTKVTNINEYRITYPNSPQYNVWDVTDNSTSNSVKSYTFEVTPINQVLLSVVF